jgi:hypothetical protein
MTFAVGFVLGMIVMCALVVAFGSIINDGG